MVWWAVWQERRRHGWDFRDIMPAGMVKGNGCVGRMEWIGHLHCKNMPKGVKRYERAKSDAKKWVRGIACVMKAMRDDDDDDDGWRSGEDEESAK